MNIPNSGSTLGSGSVANSLKHFTPDQDGLGAFVILDYSVDALHPRHEHAVVLLPEHWNSLYDLIRAPGNFMEMWRNRYSSTPKINPMSQVPTPWHFKGPITIVIEPLTIPSPSCLVLLESLSTLYPAYKSIVDSSLTEPAAFKQLVIEGASANKLPKKSKTKQATEYDNWISTGSNPFPLQYVAEFALLTHTLTIWYIPRDLTGNLNSKGEIFYDNLDDQITAITENIVDQTRLSLLHFDLVMPANVSFSEMNDKRTRFAINLMADYEYLLNNVPIVKNSEIGKPYQNALFLNANTSFQASSAQLSLHESSPSQYDSTDKDIRPLFSSVLGPTRIVMDSVLPFPTDDDEVIYPCILIPTVHMAQVSGSSSGTNTAKTTTQMYPVPTVTIKAYAPPPPPPPPPVVGPNCSGTHQN